MTSVYEDCYRRGRLVGGISAVAHTIITTTLCQFEAVFPMHEDNSSSFFLQLVLIVLKERVNNSSKTVGNIICTLFDNAHRIFHLINFTDHVLPPGSATSVEISWTLKKEKGPCAKSYWVSREIYSVPTVGKSEKQYWRHLFEWKQPSIWWYLFKYTITQRETSEAYYLIPRRKAEKNSQFSQITSTPDGSLVFWMWESAQDFTQAVMQLVLNCQTLFTGILYTRFPRRLLNFPDWRISHFSGEKVKN